MSQEKVDLRKEQKHNRKKILKKQKMEHILLAVGGIVVAVAIVVWAGFSAHTKYEEKKSLRHSLSMMSMLCRLLMITS